MPASISDATTTLFIDCRAGDVLAPGGVSTGYFISVGLGPWKAAQIDPIGVVLGERTTADVAAQCVDELATSLLEWSRFSVVQYGRAPVLVDDVAVIGAATMQNAANLTCAELVAYLGQHSPLNIIRLARVDVGQVLNPAQQPEARGEQQTAAQQEASKSAELNPVNAIRDFSKKLGIGLGVALALLLVVLGVVYFKKPAIFKMGRR